MSAVFDTPLNGLGVIPLVSSVEGLSMSESYRDALNVLVSACRGKRRGSLSHTHIAAPVAAAVHTEGGQIIAQLVLDLDIRLDS